MKTAKNPPPNQPNSSGLSEQKIKVPWAQQTEQSLPPQFDPNRLIRLKEVLRIVPVAASTWWGWVATGKAPARVRLGNRCTCWRYSEVIALLEKEG